MPRQPLLLGGWYLLWYLGSSPCNLSSSGKPDRLALLARPGSRRSSSLSRLQRLLSVTPLGPASYSSSLLLRAENIGSLSPLEGWPSSHRECPDSTNWDRFCKLSTTGPHSLSSHWSLLCTQLSTRLSQVVWSDGHVPWWPASVSTSCFRQNHTTLSSEGELCTYLSGVICKKQIFGIITYFFQNQGQFRFLRPSSEICIVLMEFGLDPETGTCGFYFTAFDREVLRVESE